MESEDTDPSCDEIIDESRSAGKPVGRDLLDAALESFDGEPVASRELNVDHRRACYRAANPARHQAMGCGDLGVCAPNVSATSRAAAL